LIRVGICRRGGETIRDQDFVEPVENEKIENPSDDVIVGVVLERVYFVN